MTIRQRRPMGGASESRFVYRRRERTSLTERKQHYETGDRQGFLPNEIQTYIPKQGDNWLRILPPTWENAQHYGFDTYLHTGVGPDGVWVLCLNKMKGERCPVCEERTRLSNIGQSDAASELRPLYRLAVYMVDRKETDKGLQLWLMPVTIDRELITLSQDPRSGEVLWVDDPHEGYDIEFNRNGEGIHTRYVGIRIARQPSPLGEDRALEYAAKHPIPDLYQYLTAEEIQALLSPGEGVKRAETPAAPGVSESSETATATSPGFTQDEIYNTALDAMAQEGIQVPDTISDADLPAFVINALGDKLASYPPLAAAAK